MKVVEVIWLDAHCTTDSTTIKKASSQKPIRTYTIGYLVSENEHGLVLATDHYDGDKKNVKMTNFIPHGMIEEWHIYT